MYYLRYFLFFTWIFVWSQLKYDGFGYIILDIPIEIVCKLLVLIYLQGFYAIYRRVFKSIAKEETEVQRLHAGGMRGDSDYEEQKTGANHTTTISREEASANTSLEVRSNDILPPFGDSKSDYESVWRLALTIVH